MQILSYQKQQKHLGLYSHQRRREMYIIIYLWRIAELQVSNLDPLIECGPYSDRKGRNSYVVCNSDKTYASTSLENIEEPIFLWTKNQNTCYITQSLQRVNKTTLPKYYVSPYFETIHTSQLFLIGTTLCLNWLKKHPWWVWCIDPEDYLYSELHTTK